MTGINKEYNKIAKMSNPKAEKMWTVNKKQYFTLAQMVENCKFFLEELAYYKEWCIKYMGEAKYNEAVNANEIFISKYKALV